MSALGEMWGEHGVHAPFCFVACREGRKPFTKFGGAVVDSLQIEHDTWERWRGTMILIPRIIEVSRNNSGGTLGQMVVGPMRYDVDVEDLEERSRKKNDSFWRPTWWAKDFCP